MKGWHIDDYHDKAVPYDAFIKKMWQDRKDSLIIKFWFCLAFV